MTRIFTAAALLVFSAASVANGEGFSGGRDENLNFHVHKNQANAITVLSKLPAETIKMTAKQFTGQLNINPAKLDSATGEFTVPFKNLDMPSKTMKEHMLSPTWIDATQHPDAKFTITGIEKVTPKKKTIEATLKGKMAIHGVEKEMSIPVTMAYTKDTRKDSKKDTLSIRAKFEIKLADFEIKGRDGKPNNGAKGVADTLQMTVNIHMGVGEQQVPPPKVKVTRTPHESR